MGYVENGESGKSWKIPNAKNWGKLENANKQAQTYEDQTISFINEFIHVIDKFLGATGLRAVGWYGRTCYTVHLRHKGIPLGQQRHGMLHGNLPCLSAVATIW